MQSCLRTRLTVSGLDASPAACGLCTAPSTADALSIRDVPGYACYVQHVVECIMQLHKVWGCRGFGQMQQAAALGAFESCLHANA